MQQNYNLYSGDSNTLSCSTANSPPIKIAAVKDLVVFDSGAYKCDCNSNGNGGNPPCAGATTRDCQGKPIGTYFAACTGNDDVVEVGFSIDIEKTSNEFDVAFYVNTNSGDSAVSGTNGGGGCVIQGLSTTDASGTTTYSNVNNEDGDGCLDLKGSGDLSKHPFPKVMLSCRDSTGNDGLLDIRVGVSYAEGAGRKCTFEVVFTKHTFLTDSFVAIFITSREP